MRSWSSSTSRDSSYPPAFSYSSPPERPHVVGCVPDVGDVVRRRWHCWQTSASRPSRSSSRDRHPNASLNRDSSRSAVLVDLGEVAEDEADVRVLLERGHDLGEAVRTQQVIVVQLDQEVARGFFAGAPLGRPYAREVVVHYYPYPWIIDLGAPPHTLVEHDHPFPVRKGLRPESLVALVQEPGAVARCEDRDLGGPFIGCHHS